MIPFPTAESAKSPNDVGQPALDEVQCTLGRPCPEGCTNDMSAALCNAYESGAVLTDLADLESIGPVVTDTAAGRRLRTAPNHRAALDSCAW